MSGQREQGNPWNRGRGGARTRTRQNHQAPKEQKEKEDKKTGAAKFQEAHLMLQKSVKKHLDQAELESSSEEEDLETDDILGSVLRSYSQVGGKSEDLGRTQNFLESTFQSGAAVCLICIGSVKRTESIWSCESCYGFFHLLCVQRWAKDSIAHQKLTLEERPDKISANILWQCPKCRKDYEPSLIPYNYECFCGKVVDPEFHPWLVPHSCGETCNRPLKPECGHSCLLLCHPGPCPPCPKMVKSNCYCSNGGVKSVRCSRKEWSCDGLCRKTLSCGKHNCSRSCHPPPCPPCTEQSRMPCGCGLSSKLVPCAQLSWKCEKVCGNKHKCGQHICEVVCHKGDCGPCPRSLPRSCPCGNDTQLLPCTEEISTCGGTCGKLLDCGFHTCSRRCHRGDCGMCVELRVKMCRCGLHSKEVSCNKDYICEAKCKRMRDCNVHPCNRKCCNGNCPPCEKPCGKTLKCGQHKCTSVCHRGTCYPCNLTKQISCFCGLTVITVPCGIARRRHPPKCNKLCSIPPKCHHPSRENHKCHFGSCPPCKQPCGIAKACGHICYEPCHSVVLTYSDPNYKPGSPWEKMIAPVEEKALPCPICIVPVKVPCLGLHEELVLPCHRSVPQPCGRPCQRTLPCGNHTCHLPCHTVENAPDNVHGGENCAGCSSDCLVERPEGCKHDCPLPCHPPPCPPCQFIIKMRCHCTLTQLYIKCSDWNQASEMERNERMSCGNQCPKSYECGHRCNSICHNGDCPGSNNCRRKVKITCDCKRIKKEYQCSLVAKGQVIVTCDDVCVKIKQQKKQDEEIDKEKSRQEEEKRNRNELEQYEKRLQGRKRPRKRTITNDEDDPSFFYRFRYLLIAFFILIVAVSVSIAFLE